MIRASSWERVHSPALWPEMEQMEQTWRKLHLPAKRHLPWFQE